MDKRSETQFPKSHVKVLRALDDEDIPQFADPDVDRDHTTKTNNRSTTTNVRRDYDYSTSDKDNFESSTYIRHPQTKKVMGAGYAGPSYEEADAPIDTPGKARQMSFNRASTDAVESASRGGKPDTKTYPPKNPVKPNVVQINTDPAKGK